MFSQKLESDFIVPSESELFDWLEALCPGKSIIFCQLSKNKDLPPAIFIVFHAFDRKKKEITGHDGDKKVVVPINVVTELEDKSNFVVSFFPRLACLIMNDGYWAYP